MPAFGPQVDDPIGGLDHFQIVLDDQHRVAGVGKIVEHFQQQLDVGKVQPGGRLVQQVERSAGALLTSSRASLMRWASPPESVGEGWPSFT